MSSVETCYYDVNSGEMVQNGDTAPAPKPAASWRDREPRHVHSMKWVDADGIEHMHVLRSDDLDDVLKEMATIKQCIKAAKAQAAERKAAAQLAAAEAIAQQGEPPTPPAAPHAPAAAPEPMPRCPLHPTEIMRVHTKGEQQWKSHRLPDGTWCRGR